LPKELGRPKEIIVLENVTKTYQTGKISFQALRGISLTVERGEFIAIMGPSGHGKTTLLNIIGLLDKPTSGRVVIDGIDTTPLGEDQLARLRNTLLGFVFQQYNLINRMSILENVELPLILRGIPRRKRIELVKEAIRKVGGDESWLLKKPNQLSGGQQQRVAIARAIVGDPEILLADEPTGNLDTASSKIVMETFKNLHKLGKTIVMVTHNVEVANCSEKILLIRDGRIIAETEPDSSRCILNT